MPIRFNTIGDGLTRSATWLSNTIEVTMGVWVKVDALPTSSNKYCIWHWGDIAHINPYWAIYWGSSGIYMTIFDGSSTTNTSTTSQITLYPDEWYYISFSYFTGSTTRLYINGQQFFTLTKTISSITFVEKVEYLGTDTGSSLAGIALEYDRIWNNLASVGLQTLLGPAGSIEKGRHAAYETSLLRADTPLTTASDLADISGNSRNWSLTNNAATENPGPLDLVAGEFDSNFNNTPVFNDWTYWQASLGVDNVGCAGSPAIGCGGHGTIWRQFNATYNDAAVRSIVWPNLTGASSGVVQGMGTIFNYDPDVTHTPFQAVWYAKKDGTVRIRLTTAPSTTQDFDSSPGAIPTNGTPGAFQFLAHCDSAIQRAKLYRNNILILDTGDISSTGLTSTDRNINMFNLVVPDPSGGYQTVMDNVEFDNVGAVEDWTRCTSNKVINCGIVPVDNSGGIYKLVPGKTNDTIYTDVETETTEDVKIPDPSASGYLAGDE